MHAFACQRMIKLAETRPLIDTRATRSITVLQSSRMEVAGRDRATHGGASNLGK